MTKSHVYWLIYQDLPSIRNLNLTYDPTCLAEVCRIQLKSGVDLKVILPFRETDSIASEVVAARILASLRYDHPELFV